jgi:hypothetical protein
VIGFDYQEEFLAIARNYHCKKFKSACNYATDIAFIEGDIYNADSICQKLRIEYGELAVNGIVFLQTLSWLTDWKKILPQLASFDSEWIAISSLFYKGLIEAEITIRSFSGENEISPRQPYDTSPYNVYSAPLVEDFLAQAGFKKFSWREFEIKTPLEKPCDPNKMRTYTIETTSGKLLQVSGQIMMPWHFLIAQR